MTKPTNIIELAIGDAQVRITPSKRVALFDVLKAAVGKKNPRQAWKDLQAQHPEVVGFTDNFIFPGKGQRPTPTVDKHGFTEIMMLLPGTKAAEFRRRSADIIVRYLEADETLTMDLIGRTEDEAVLQRIELRARTKRTNKVVNRAITEADANCYSQMADMRNVAVCGRTAKELKRLRGVTQTRDGMTDAELTLIAASEELEASAIKLRKARGNGEVLTVGMDVTTDIAELRRRYFGPLSLPAGNAEAVPVLQVEI